MLNYTITIIKIFSPFRIKVKICNILTTFAYFSNKMSHLLFKYTSKRQSDIFVQRPVNASRIPYKF